MLKPPLQSASGKEVQYIKTILKKKNQKTKKTVKSEELKGQWEKSNWLISRGKSCHEYPPEIIQALFSQHQLLSA